MEGEVPAARAAGYMLELYDHAEFESSNLWPPNSSPAPAVAMPTVTLVGHMLEFSDHEESGGSSLWPTDSRGQR